MLRTILFALALTLTLTGTAAAQKSVTLEGQLVCSLCWFEADRNTTAYGTAADIECAKDCAEKGIPTAIAVKENAGYKLYVIEEGRFKRDSKAWLDYIGKQVQLTGRAHTKEKKDYVVVDDLKVIAAPASDNTQSAVGVEAELALKDLFGVEQKLSAYRGKIVVLNFWATWCVPCRKEMPDLAAIQNEYAAFGVQVVGATADTIDTRSKVINFIKETRINFPVWMGATTADMGRFGLGPALPGTAIIGRDGKIISVRPTVITQAELRKQLDALLASDSAAIKREVASAKPRESDASLIPS
jgi:thiol-disulfide isomerase/thioredoxin